MNKDIEKFQICRKTVHLKKQENLKKKEKIKIIKLCPICNNNFITYNKKMKYCSYDCSSFAKRKVKRPDREELIYLIKIYPMTAIGRQFNVSDNAIRKWAKSYNIDIKGVKKKCIC